MSGIHYTVPMSITFIHQNDAPIVTTFYRSIPLEVYDRQTFELPVDTDIVGLEVKDGRIHLLTKPGKSEQTWRRFFYALDDDRVMDYPDLGYIGSVFVGPYHFHVFEDDLCTLFDSEVLAACGSPSSRRMTPFVTWFLGTRKVAVASLRAAK